MRLRNYLNLVHQVVTALPEDYSYDEEDVMEVWGLMHRLTPLGAGLANRTLETGTQAQATECLSAFCRSLTRHSPITDDSPWLDSEFRQCWTDGWPDGSPAASVRLYLSRWAAYPQDGYTDRLGCILYELRLLWHSGKDSLLRMLQRTLLFVAATCRNQVVEKEWHELVDDALKGPELADDEIWGYNSVEHFLATLSGTPEAFGWPVDVNEGLVSNDLLEDAPAREMVRDMLVARLAGQRMVTALAGQQLDALTYAAGTSYIGELYRRKWRRVGRCWRARAAALTWHRQVRAKLKAARLKRMRVAVLVRLFALRLHRRVEAMRRTEREADWAAACTENPIVGGQPGLYHAVYDMAWEAGRVRGLKRLRSTTTDA